MYARASPASVRKAVAVALMLAGTAQPAGAGRDLFGDAAPVEAERLEQLRGGFQNSQGQLFSFAIERAVVINGEVVSSTRLVLNDLSPLLAGQVPSVEVITNAVRTIIQNGPGNTAPGPVPAASNAVAASSVPASAQAVSAAIPPLPIQTPSSAVNGVAPVTAVPAAMPFPVTSTTPVSAPSPPAAPAAIVPALATNGVAASRAVGQPVVAASGAQPAPPAPQLAIAPPAQSQGPAVAPTAQAARGLSPGVAPAVTPLVVQMNAGGRSFVIPNGTGIVTAVQNSLNDQLIQTHTTIDAVLSSLSALRANILSEVVRLQGVGAVRGR